MQDGLNPFDTNDKTVQNIQTKPRIGASAIEQLKPLYGYIRSFIGSYLLGGLFLIITNATALLIPWLLKLAIDSIKSGAATGRPPAFYGIAIIIAAIVHGIIRIFSRTSILHAARKIEYSLREDMYARLLKMDLTFFGGERTGDLLSRFANDLTNVRMLIGFGVLNLINSFIVYSAGLFLMTRISPTLTLMVILPFPLMLIAVRRISSAMYHHSKRAQEELANLSSNVEENVSAAMLIRAYCREDDAIRRFAAASDSYMKRNMHIARLRGMMIPVMAATGALGTLITLLAGGEKVASGAMTLGEFVAFSSYLSMLVWPTIIMGWILTMIQRGSASMSRINRVLQASPLVTEPAEPLHADLYRPDIKLNNLEFSIEGKKLLAGLSLSIPYGTKLGVVGPVGSGKSTLARVLARLYPVTDGELLLDGIDVNRLPLATVRSLIGYVPQESLLFSRSLATNIAFGKEGASGEEIREASIDAALHNDAISFPEGYESMVGERGITLSGGQKQRTALARALLRNPAILILDDPLSAVDTDTEREILASLEKRAKEKTVIIISHRLSALQGCDRIIFLDEGGIVEQGSHAELLAMNGRYASLQREQERKARLAAL